MAVDSLRLTLKKKEVMGVSVTQLTSRISWSIIDQVAFSGAGFLMNMFLIWRLPGDGYGLFAVSFAVFLMLAGAHDSFVLEPVSVLGSSVHSSDLSQYMSYLIILHFGICFGIMVASMLAFAFIPLGSIFPVLMVMALTLPFILLIWTSRRLCYIESRSKVAAQGSFVYLLSVVGLSLAAFAMDSLASWSGFLIMALAAVPATIVILMKLPVGPSKVPLPTIPGGVRTISREHWSLGRWVSVQKLSDIAINQLGIMMTSLLVGVSAAGVLRALTFVVMPLLQVTQAITSMLALPIVAREYGRGNMTRVKQLSSRLTVGIVAISIGYLLTLIVLQQPIARFITMAGDLPSSWVIALKGVSPVILALGGGAAIALRATQRVAYYPLSSAVPGVFAAICTPLMVMSWGLTGAIVSGIATSIVATLLGVGLYRRWV